MEKSKIKSVIFLITIIVIILMAFAYEGISENMPINKNEISNNVKKQFNIIASSENKDLEQIIINYAKQKKYDVNIEYAGTLDIMQKLKDEPKKYDAVWVSNSIWLYMLDRKYKCYKFKIYKH